MTTAADPRRALAPIADFADAMSALAGGVVLVTSWVGDRPWGMTVTTFASVTVNPPTVLVSLGSATMTARAIAATGRFGVSVLAAEQLDVARLGSRPGAAKFLDPYVDRDAESDSPVVTGALAHLDCALSDTVHVVDHVIVFGHVRSAHASGCRAPLLYHRRDYQALACRSS